MPGNYDAEAHRSMREVASRFPGTEKVREWFTHGKEVYYNLLAPRATRVDLWTTEYIHVMDGPEDIVEWYKGTGMRPFLDALPSEAERARFTAEYLAAIRHAYPARPGGHVLFPFRRLFLVAYR
jgi:trans-aconitate 2-methyltransferase